MEKNQRGFSLFELMIVIAIISILAAIATPNFLSWRESSRLRGSAFNLKSDLELAKMRAIRGGGNVIVKLDLVNSKYEIFHDTNSNGTKDSGEALIASKELAPITLETLSSGIGTSTGFTSRGMAVKTGDIKLKSNSQTITININKIGLITIL